MSVESEITAALGPLVEGRVFVDTFAQPDGMPQWPAIRFQLIDGRSEQTVCGTDTEDTDDSTYQIDVVAETGKAARELASLVIVAMDTLPSCPTVRTARRNDPFDAPTKTFRVSLDFLVSPSSDGA